MPATATSRRWHAGTDVEAGCDGAKHRHKGPVDLCERPTRRRQPNRSTLRTCDIVPRLPAGRRGIAPARGAGRRGTIGGADRPVSLATVAHGEGHVPLAGSGSGTSPDQAFGVRRPAPAHTPPKRSSACAKSPGSTLPPEATTITASPLIWPGWNKAAARATAPPGSSTSFRRRNASAIACSA